MRYAEHECAGCGRMLPAYELAEVSDRVESGISKHERYNRKFGIYQRSGQTRRYANRVKRLCGSCRFKRLIAKLLIPIAVVAWAFLSPHGEHKPALMSAPSQKAVGAPLGDEQQPIGEQDVVSADREPPPSVDDAERQPAPTAREQAPPVSIASSEDVASSDAVRSAVIAALASGTAERWHFHKLDGYVVPSTADANGCRMIQVSVDDGEQLPAEKRCPGGAPPTEAGQ